MSYHKTRYGIQMQTQTQNFVCSHSATVLKRDNNSNCTSEVKNNEIEIYLL